MGRRAQEVERPSDADCAWAAGIVDGEGCVFLQHRQRKGSDTFVLSLTVANTNRLMIDRLHSLFGGYVYSRRSTRPGPWQPSNGFRPMWVWSVYCGRAEAVLSWLILHLVAKHEEVRLGLIARTYQRGGYSRRYGNPAWSTLKDIALQMKALRYPHRVITALGRERAA